MAVRLKFVKALKDLFGVKKAANKRILLEKQKEETAHFDAVNQDIVNVVAKKRETKGIKIFLEFLEVVQDWFNRSLYWIQRSDGQSAIAQPKPTEYINYPREVRLKKTLSKAKLRSITQQKAEQFKATERKTFKENFYNEEKSSKITIYSSGRQSFLTLMQAKQNSSSEQTR